MVALFTGMEVVEYRDIANSSLDFDFENSFIFLDNSAVAGGGLIVNYSSVSSSGVSQFINNSAEGDGGVFYVKWYSSVSFSGVSHFINNSAEGDGGVCNIFGCRAEKVASL